MSLPEESCLETPYCKILQRRPTFRMRRNPSKKKLLLNVMPVSRDPGLSPSTSHWGSPPTSHRSSRSSTSEFEQAPHSSLDRQGGKISQLIKVNEAIAVELADLESGKERWLEKLKLLEARVCSNLVNIENWAAENKSKVVSIQAAADDDGIVGDIKVGEVPVPGAPSTWQFSLADLVSIFKGSKSEHGNRLPLRHLRDRAFRSPKEENMRFNGQHEGTTSPSKGGIHGPNDSQMGNLTSRGSAYLYADIPVSSGKGSTLSNGASFPVDMAVSSVKEGDSPCKNVPHSPEHPSEAYGVVSREGRNFAPMGANFDVEGSDGSWDDKVSAYIDANHAAEGTSMLGNTLLRRVTPSNEISPSRRAAYPPHNGETQHLGTSLALNGKSILPRNSEQASGDSKRVKKGMGDSIGDEVVSPKYQGKNEYSQSSNEVLEAELLPANELLSQTALGQARLHDAVGQATEELQQLKQHTLTVEKEKADLESTLRDCKQALQDATSEAASLTTQKEQLQTLLTERKTSSESARLALMKEKEDQEKKLLSSMQSLEETQQRALVLERKKFVLESELNHFRQAFERAQNEVLSLRKEKAVVEHNFTGCKQMLKEAQDNAAHLQKERDDLAAESSEHKTSLERIQQQCLMLEKEKDELRSELTESKGTLEKVLENSSSIERERKDLEAAYTTLRSEFENSEQRALMLENENCVFENVLTEFKHTLEETQQQVMVLEREKDELERELGESKQACDEAWQHALSLEEEKGALEIGSSEYKQVLEETEQHVSTLQSALEGTLQRADALDHQVQRLRSETKRLCESNESLQALKNELEAKFMDLEAQRAALQAEMENIRSQKEAAEESMVKVNDLYVLAIEDTRKEKEAVQALQNQQSLLQKEKDSLKVLFERATQRCTLLEDDKEELQVRLKDVESSLQKAMQELDELNAENGNEIAALKVENAANESQIQELMEQTKEKDVELGRLYQVEAEYTHLIKKFKYQESQLENTAHELESMKADLAGTLANLENEKAAKDAILQELNTKKNMLKEVEEELNRIRAEQAALRGAMKDEIVIKKELMKKLRAEEGHSKELEVALEFANLEQSSLLMDVEDERMAKEAALEELARIKEHSEEVEKEFDKLQAEVRVMLEEENEEKEDVLQALREEQSTRRELEEAVELKNAEQEDTQVAWEDERHVNEALVKELEQEQRQRMQLEEELKVFRAAEEHSGASLRDERAAVERLKKQLYAQEARCRELENELNCARIEQEGMQMELEEEAMLKRAVMQELEDQQNWCVESKHVKKDIDADHKREILSLEVTELLGKSKRLEQMLTTMQENEGNSSNDAARSAAAQEVKELQSRIQHIESRLHDARYLINEGGQEKNEDELLSLLENSSTFEPKATGLEAQVDKNCDKSMEGVRQSEEEIRKLKESTETLHQALFDAHHTAISDVAGLLVELKSLKRLLDDKTMVASDRKEEKKKVSMSLPTAALSTSALAAIGLLAFLKFPKHSLHE